MGEDAIFFETPSELREAEEARDAAEQEPWLRRRTLGRLRRELHRIRRADFFPPAEREQAEAAVEQLAATFEEVLSQ